MSLPADRHCQRNCRSVVLSLAVDDPPFAEIIRGEFDVDFIARHNADEVLPHATRHVSQNFGSRIELYPETSVGQRLGHSSTNDERFFLLGHRGSSTRCWAMTYLVGQYIGSP